MKNNVFVRSSLVGDEDAGRWQSARDEATTVRPTHALCIPLNSFLPAIATWLEYAPLSLMRSAFMPATALL